MGNYGNLCSEIGVKNLSPKTVAKLPFLIGNLFQVDSHLFQWQISHIYSHPEVIKAAAGSMSCAIMSSVKVDF